MDLTGIIRQTRMEPPSDLRDEKVAALEILLANPEEAQRIFAERIEVLSPAEKAEFYRIGRPIMEEEEDEDET